MRTGAKFFWVLTVWWLALLAGPVRAQTATLFTVEENGSRAQRINIVFLSEGYTAAELPNFAGHVQTAVNFLFSKEPWQQYRSYCNVYRIEIASNQSGCDNGTSSGAGGLRDTYFSTGFNTSSVTQLLTLAGTGSSRVYSLLNTHVPEYDVPVVLVNDTKYGGSGGSLSVASINSLSAAIVEHEIGHSFAGLADEYDTEYTSYTPSEKANATAQTSRDLVKWNYWIDSTTPVPTPETTAYDSFVGLFEGCMYRIAGWYRPHNNSLMRNLNRPCGAVNREQFVLNYYSRVSPIDASSPSTTSRSVTAVENLAFSVTPKVPSSGVALLTTWRVDGVLKANATASTFNIASDIIGNGTHTVTATVADPTTFVRRDTAGLLDDTVTWSLTLSNQPPPNAAITLQPVGHTVNPGASVVLSVAATGSTLSYQWKKGGVDIAGATGATYTIAAAAETDEGSYSVVVGNSLGSVTSSVALLSVNDPVVITGQPVGGRIVTGNTLSLSVVAQGTPVISYQWRKDGTNLGGANGGSLLLQPSSVWDGGVYDVVVTNVVGSVVSVSARVSVSEPSVAFSEWIGRWSGLADLRAEGDPDGDGVSNLMEYYAGTSPAEGGGEGLPRFGMSAGAVWMVYRRSKTIVGVAGVVEWSASLAEPSWSVAGVEEVVVDRGDYEEVAARVSLSGGQRAKFLRLRLGL